MIEKIETIHTVANFGASFSLVHTIFFLILWTLMSKEIHRQGFAAAAAVNIGTGIAWGAVSLAAWLALEFLK